MKMHIDTALVSIDQLTAAYHSDGRWKAACQLLEQGIKLADKSAENKLCKATYQNQLADILWKQGSIQQAQYLSESAKTIAEIALDQVTVANSLYNLGEIAYIQHFLMGKEQLDLVFKFHYEAYTIRQEVQDIVGIIQSLSRLGVLHERNQEYSTALNYYQKSIQIAENTNHQHAMTRALNHIGVYYRRNDDLPNALTFFQRSLSINQSNENMELVVFALDLVGEALYDLNQDFEEAYAYFHQALEIAKLLDFKLAIIRTLFLIGNLYSKIGKTNEAIDAYEQITNIASSVNYQTLLNAALSQIAHLQIHKHQS